MSDLTVNTDIEYKVNEILTAKLQQNTNIQDLNENDIQTIKKLFDLFPSMKKKFGKYLDNKNKHNYDPVNMEIVLDEFSINNTTYYKDTRGGIWDNDANLVGIVSNDSKYIFFDQKFTEIDLQNIFL